MGEGRPFKIYDRPELQNSALIVAWNQDVGKVGPRVADYLRQKLGSRRFAEIDPMSFFPLGGVSVVDDVAQFPESNFYCCQKKSLVVFKSDVPAFEWYQFLSLILDIAQDYCDVKEIYVIGGMVSPGAHTAPRVLLSVANSPAVKSSLTQYDIITDMNYETPDGQRPTLSSFLLWVAKTRSIAGASLWVPVPFYLVSIEDPRAWKKVIEFLDRRFGLGIDYTDLNAEVEKQNERIAQLRRQSPELDDYIGKLESSLSLTVDESERLVRKIEEFLGGQH